MSHDSQGHSNQRMACYHAARVTNTTRDTSVAERCLIARGVAQRIFGLHLLPKLGAGEGLLLPGATTIDTTFMRYPIDLIFLDGAGRVTRIVADMRPWRMVLSGAGGSDCLELPSGAAAASRTQVGDMLEIASG
jgi:uncharacterized membrane protein (UPF0127 family)